MVAFHALPAPLAGSFHHPDRSPAHQHLQRISIEWNYLQGGQRRALARRAHQSMALGGHAEPVIGPAEGRTRWLCPPYDVSK